MPVYTISSPVAYGSGELIMGVILEKTEINDGCMTTHLLTERNIHLGDNCIQILHLGRYIVGYTVGNFVLRRHVIR